MSRHSTFFRLARTLSALGSAWILALAPLCAVVTLATGPASADEEADLSDQKAYWQERYRSLLSEAALHEENARRARENYQRSQKRNYPRGGARQQFLVDEAEAKKALAALQQKIEQFKLEARRAGAMPGWLYDVEEEPISFSEPAAPDGWDDSTQDEDEEDDAEDREGRNPLYFEDEDSEDEDER